MRKSESILTNINLAVESNVAYACFRYEDMVDIQQKLGNFGDNETDWDIVFTDLLLVCLRLRGSI